MNLIFILGAPVVILHCSIYLFNDYLSILSLVPANTLITHTYVWNLVTSCFFETNLIKLALDLFLLVSVASHVKPTSIEQFFLYMIFSILTSTLGTSFLCFLQFGIFGDENGLVTPYFGFSGILMALFMFCRQASPNHSWISKIPILTYQYLPLVYFIFITLCSWFSLLTHDFYFMFISFFFSWSYLRFYYRFDEGVTNYLSEEFAFISMFPEVRMIVSLLFPS
jgi:hypothetical protein